MCSQPPKLIWNTMTYSQPPCSFPTSHTRSRTPARVPTLLHLFLRSITLSSPPAHVLTCLQPLSAVMAPHNMFTLILRFSHAWNPGSVPSYCQPFLSASAPEKGEELPLEEFGSALGSGFGGALGKYSMGLISRLTASHWRQNAWWFQFVNYQELSQQELGTRFLSF